MDALLKELTRGGNSDVLRDCRLLTVGYFLNDECEREGTHVLFHCRFLQGQGPNYILGTLSRHLRLWQ